MMARLKPRSSFRVRRVSLSPDIVDVPVEIVEDADLDNIIGEVVAEAASSE